MKLKNVMAMGMAAIMSLGLVACGNGNSGTSATKTESGEIEIKLPTYLAGENVGATFFLPQVERFNEKYSGKYKITVEQVLHDSYA